MSKISLGDRVKDRITQLTGIVVGYTHWLFGCERVTIQPESSKDGKPAELLCIDVPQCELVQAGVVQSWGAATAPADGPAGPRVDPERGHEVIR